MTSKDHAAIAEGVSHSYLALAMELLSGSESKLPSCSGCQVFASGTSLATRAH
jgi:hypothetical protein